MVESLDDGLHEIKAGTFILLPPGETPPEHTVLLCGQSLSRDQYPELSEIYPGGMRGGTFELPNHSESVITGFDIGGIPILGSLAVYFESVPDSAQPAPNIPFFMRVD